MLHISSIEFPYTLYPFEASKVFSFAESEFHICRLIYLTVFVRIFKVDVFVVLTVDIYSRAPFYDGNNITAGVLLMKISIDSFCCCVLEKILEI